MDTVKVIIHVYNKNLTNTAQSYIRAEKVARFGSVQEEICCYEPYKDVEVNVCLRYVCWSTGELVPSFYIDKASLRVALEKINLFILE